MITGHTKYLFTIAALLTGCFFVLPACENDVNEVNDLFQKKTGVEEANQIESYLSQDGFVKAKLVAPYMRRFITDRSDADSPYLEFPRSLHVDFFDTTATRESYLDAKYGKYFELERKVLLRDSVVVINIKNGDTLRTNKLWWDQNKSEFYTDDTAHIFQPDKIILAAKGLQATQDLNNITFFSSSGVLAVPKEDSTSTGPTDSLSTTVPDSLRISRPRPPLRRDSAQ